MKTILINIFDSNVARNILRTDVLATLKREASLRIVVLVPPNKKEAYTKEFSDARVVIDTLPRVSPTRLELLAVSLSRSSIPTHTVRQGIEAAFLKGGKFRRLKYWSRRALSFMSRFTWWKYLLRLVLVLPIRAEVFADIVSTYTPDLVFSPTIYDTNDFRLLKYCRTRGIPSIGMIKSWDNLTSKDFLLVKPEYLVVHNERIRDEAEKYGNYPEGRICVSGIPQFDIYQKEGIVMDRKEFFDKFQLDPDRKLILYAAVGSWLFPRERDAIETLARIVHGGKLDYPAQLYVRLHPAYTSEDKVLDGIKNITIFRPGKATAQTAGLRSAWEFDEEETRILASTIRWSDVSINCGSTMSIESAFFDKPIINLDFDGRGGNDLYWKSVRRMYRREHYLPLKNSGGIRFPENEDALVADINRYLHDPSLDAAGRRTVTKEQCYATDGQAGNRIGAFILSKLAAVHKE